MQFNSYIFILVFLPVSIVIYHMVNRYSGSRGKLLWGKLVLILSSLVFYGYADWRMCILLCISIVLNYLFVMAVGKLEKCRRVFTFIPVCLNLILLLYYKYSGFLIINVNRVFSSDFALRNIVLPIGISFYTFQQIAYVVSLYRGEISESNLIDYATYILYYPKLFMGPLMEPGDFLSQINNPGLRYVDWDNMAAGCRIFSIGLFKKVLIADVFAGAVSWGFNGTPYSPGAVTSFDWILVMFFYTFEIYFDFSGYSDMATGVSLMMNIMLPINFDSPYKALSIRDFWKRWHMSLTAFFTKYIYIPLGGSKKGDIYTILNVLTVFLISGIWHGANWTFLLWGIIHGMFMLFDRIIEKIEKKNTRGIFEPFRWLCTFVLISVLWLLFRSDSIDRWIEILRTITQFQDTSINEQLFVSFDIPELLVLDRILDIDSTVRGFHMIIYIAVAMLICFVPENAYRQIRKLSVTRMLLSAILLVCSVLHLGSETLFIYNCF